MACIQLFRGSLAWGCFNNVKGSTLGKYTEAVLINASDIVSFSAAENKNVTLVLASGLKGQDIQSVNNGVKVSVARKGGDIFPVMYDPSATMKIPDDLFSIGDGEAHNLVNSNFAIALKGSNGYTIIGLGAPLVWTEIEGDSTTSEFLTVTFGTDEGQTGSTIYGISVATYAALKVPAI